MFSRNFYSAFLCLFYEPLLERKDLFCLLRDHCATQCGSYMAAEAHTMLSGLKTASETAIEWFDNGIASVFIGSTD